MSEATLELELIRDTYSRDMGTFGVLSVYQRAPYAMARKLVSSEEVRELMGHKPGGVIRVDTVDDIAPLPAPREKLFECHTVERPWANNAPNISCIPEGTYTLKSRRFYRGGYDTWEVTNVPGRSLILIHKGNTAEHVEGCIALGTRRGVVGGRWAVTHSKQAFEKFLEHVPPDKGYDVSLTIAHWEPWGEPRRLGGETVAAT